MPGQTIEAAMPSRAIERGVHKDEGKSTDRDKSTDGDKSKDKDKDKDKDRGRGRGKSDHARMLRDTTVRYSHPA
jgi:hypothetical protein